MLKKFIYYVKRSTQLGFVNAVKRINYHLTKKRYAHKWQKKALSFNAGHQWQAIAKKHCFSESFQNYLTTLKNKKFVMKLMLHKKFQKCLPSKKEIFKYAESATKNCFNLLGSGTICFKKNNIPWHKDFKAVKIKNATWENRLDFYQAIKIDIPYNIPFEDYYPDIKVPWELARFQHLFYLGYVYHRDQKPVYALTFLNQINSWLENNPYLLGVNWLCPMEVAIRAINVIWGFYLFKDSKEIPLDFWETLVCSLYDHAIYLQNNWETSDKPNNHYLADLLGYFYLCFFFDDLQTFEKEKNKTYNKILHEFDKQVLNDGSSYEGSTGYHKLITELVFHFKLLCQTNNIKLPPGFEKKFQKTITFLSVSFFNDNELVQIGDNDSGKIVIGLNHSTHLASLGTQDERTATKHYPDFGLTIIKHKKWHITFRHPTFCKNQPTGHFHQDQLSVTLSIGQIPILIDPGSYLYTANSRWRNYFRSKQSHNSFYAALLKPNECELKRDLFQLDRKEQSDTAHIQETDEHICIQNGNTEYKKQNLIQNRKMTFYKRNNMVEIIDWWESKKNFLLNENSIWSLLFHPHIEITKLHTYLWRGTYKKKKLFTIESTLEFKLEKGFYSPRYGTIASCTKLGALTKLSKDKQTTKFKYHKN